MLLSLHAIFLAIWGGGIIEIQWLVKLLGFFFIFKFLSNYLKTTERITVKL